jgi:hypothetical protein
VLFNNLFINCNDNKLVQNYLAKLYLLWFIIVIPINISGNSKISFTDKIEEFKKIFQNHNAKEIYLQKSKKNLEIKYKFLSFLYFFNSPLILLFFSSMLQKVRSKLNLTN